MFVISDGQQEISDACNNNEAYHSQSEAFVCLNSIHMTEQYPWLAMDLQTCVGIVWLHICVVADMDTLKLLSIINLMKNTRGGVVRSFIC